MEDEGGINPTYTLQVNAEGKSVVSTNPYHFAGSAVVNGKTHLKPYDRQTSDWELLGYALKAADTTTAPSGMQYIALSEFLSPNAFQTKIGDVQALATQAPATPVYQMISNKKQGRWLFGFSTNSGADSNKVVLRDTTSSGTWARWDMTPTDDGYYTIDVLTGTRLTANSSSTVMLTTATVSPGDAEKWQLVEVSDDDGYYYIENKQNGKRLQGLALGSNPGVALTTATDNGKSTRWRLNEYAVPSGVNFALNGTASQSSTAYGGVASRANDGNTSGVYSNNSVTHVSDSDNNDWWQVDLGRDITIGQVKVWPRTDACCTNRLANFHLFMSENAITESAIADVQARNDVTEYQISGAAGIPEVINLNDINARYVRVQLTDGSSTSMNVAELQVFGSPTPTNVALAGAATLSTTGFGGVPSRAIDGNTNGIWANGSVAHTASGDTRNWWQVDLGADHDISEILLWPRVDSCCTDRLTNFYVLISDTPIGNVDLAVAQATPGVTDYRVSGEAQAPQRIEVNNISGRYVRVQLSSGSGSLNIAEVAVMGVAN